MTATAQQEQRQRESSFRSVTGRMGADLGVIVVLGLIGMAGFGSAFDSIGYLIAGVCGLIVGVVGVLLAYRLGLGILLAAAITIVLWYLFGSAIALPGESTFGVLPTVTSISDLSLGAVNGWADLLTLRAPVSLPEYINAVPYSAGAVVTLITALFALYWLPRRRRTPLRASVLLVLPLALYVTSVLLGTDHPYFPGIRGIAFACLALVWLGWRRRDGASLAVGGGASLVRRKVLGTAIIVVVAVVVGAVVGTLLAPASSQRYVLRDKVQPPFQPLTFPTPLAGFREYTKTLDSKPLFTISGLKAGQLVRLASLDTYNGEIWGVAGAEAQSESSGSFRLVGRDLPAAPSVYRPTTSTLKVTVDKYSDVWMPGTGYATSLSFAGPAAKDLQNVRYNDATGTAVLTTGLKSGTTYRVTDEVAATPSAATLKKRAIAGITPSLVQQTPDAVVAKAQQITAKATTPYARLKAIQQFLVSTGYFSHGTASDQVPSRAGHGADRMYDMVTLPTMVGDQEQYSSLFALMARSLGYPVRVVMGFDPKVTSNSGKPVTVTGNDVTAWDEVAFQGVGWVPFMPTPKNPDVPQSQVPKPQTEPQPQVRQPPRTNSDPDDLVTPVETTKTKPRPNVFGLPTWVVVSVGILLLLAILIFVPLLVIAALKRRRLRRRRTDPRGDRSAGGAWDELLDQFSELGLAIPEKTTRLRAAERLGSQFDEPVGDLRGIALLTDDAVFSGRDVEREHAERVWNEAMAATESARRRLPAVKRIIARYRVSAVRAWAHRLTAAAIAQADGTLGRSTRGKDKGDQRA